MTTKEKRERLQSEYCDKNYDCDDCKISKMCDKVDDTIPVCGMSDHKIEELYNLAFEGVTTSYDTVHRPEHYVKTSIECIDAMIETQGKEAVKDFCVCNAFKYLWRHNAKNGDEDIKKASWYLNKAVELMGEEG